MNPYYSNSKRASSSASTVGDSPKPCVAAGGTSDTDGVDADCESGEDRVGEDCTSGDECAGAKFESVTDTIGVAAFVIEA